MRGPGAGACTPLTPHTMEAPSSLLPLLLLALGALRAGEWGLEPSGETEAWSLGSPGSTSGRQSPGCQNADWKRPHCRQKGTDGRDGVCSAKKEAAAPAVPPREGQTGRGAQGRGFFSNRIDL